LLAAKMLRRGKDQPAKRKGLRDKQEDTSSNKGKIREYALEKEGGSRPGEWQGRANRGGGTLSLSKKQKREKRGSP